MVKPVRIISSMCSLVTNYIIHIYTLLYINIILYNCKTCIITLRIYRKKLYRPTHRLAFRHNLATHHRLRNERRSRVWDARGGQLSLVHQTCSRSFLRVAPWKSRWFATIIRIRTRISPFSRDRPVYRFPPSRSTAARPTSPPPSPKQPPSRTWPEWGGEEGPRGNKHHPAHRADEQFSDQCPTNSTNTRAAYASYLRCF